VSSYFLRWKGKVSGPYGREEVAEMARSGLITPQHAISTDQQNWVPAGSLGWLFADDTSDRVDQGRVDSPIEPPLAHASAPSSSPPQVTPSGNPNSMPPVASGTAGPSPEAVSDRRWLLIGIGAPVFVVLLVAGWWAIAAVREHRATAWERENKIRILELKTEADALVKQEKMAAAMDKYAGIDGVAKEYRRSVADPVLRRAIEAAQRTYRQMEPELPAIFAREWERDNGQRIRNLKAEADMYLKAKESLKAYKQVELILQLVGDRQMQDPKLGAIVSEARELKTSLYADVAEDLRREEAATIKKAEEGAEQESRKKADLVNQKGERKKRELAERAKEEQRKHDDEMRSKGLVQVDGKWMSKEQMEVEKLKAELEAMKKKNERTRITIIVINKPITDGTFPRWSVDHELRINGRDVDKITNNSLSAKFEDVEVQIGDKISARSVWKNEYGAATETPYQEPKGPWPVVGAEKKEYLIVIGQYSAQLSD
jgi:hypothetical protein